MKRLSTLAVALLLAASIYASPVSRQEASALAASFLKQPSLEAIAVPFEHLYVFNGDHCYVIVPADDVVTPIIGYSRDRCFEAESMNVNTKGWLMRIDENIQACKDAGKQPSDRVREQWDSVRNGLGLPVVNRNVVEPLVRTRWNQYGPYNNDCPEECVTGCSATAMAQVMKYWEFPNHGIGSHSYVHPDYGTLSADFGSATYDWDHMVYTYNIFNNETENAAVAALMYHCGVSMDMDYGPDGSAGNMAKMVSTMPNYFGYAPTVECLFEVNYSDAVWKSRLREELDASRPMCYTGESGVGFHAFVCDGYDEFDCFHFNWGWGGANDGYYAVGELIANPQANPNYVIVGVVPNFTIPAPDDLTAQVVQGQVQLTWTMPQEAVSCHVYRDDELIATGVTTGSYCDTTTGFGTYSYYLKAIASNGDRSWKSNQEEVTVEFTAPVPTALSASVAGDSLTLHWDMPSLLHDTLAYGTGPYFNSYGYSPTYPNPSFWGQRFPMEMLKPYAGFNIKGVSLYVTVSGPYTLNICRGDDRGVTEVLAQQTFEIDGYGWVDMFLDTPYPLDFTHDVWIVMNTPGGMYWVMAACEYDGPGLENSSFSHTHMATDFMSHATQHHSWMMKTMIEDGITYRVTRNDVVVATDLYERTFVDRNITSGDWNYKIWSSYQGVECDEPVSFSISLREVETVASDNAFGTIEGDGLYEVGSTATVEAVANDGYMFMGWLENGVEVSTDNPYVFCVEDSRNLVAVFGRKYFTVIATTGMGGTITPSGNVTVERGEDITFVMTPNQGCSVLQVIVDDEDVGSMQSYTFSDVTDDHTINVQFKGYGVEENFMEVWVVPNPVKDELHVESTAFIRRYEIATMNGVMVENKKVDNYSMDCHLGGYAEGVYFLRLFTDEGVVTKKIVVSE